MIRTINALAFCEAAAVATGSKLYYGYYGEVNFCVKNEDQKRFLNFVLSGNVSCINEAFDSVENVTEAVEEIKGHYYISTNN